MSAAATTPNVKGIAICDEAFGSDIEVNVFDLERVRHQIGADSFPCVRTFFFFLHVECAGPGTFVGNIRLINAKTQREARRVPVTLDFEEAEQNVGQVILVRDCRFPLSGRYNVEVWFWDHDGREVQKGERTFDLVEEESP